MEIKQFDFNINWLIEDSPEKYFEADWFIKEHYLELLQLHRNNYILNQDCLRLDNVEYNDSTKTLKVWLSRVKCFDHLVTNVVMDYQIKPDITLRSFYESGETMIDLQYSKMANALGINAFVFLNDGTLLLPVRGRSASVSKNMITSSLAFGCFCNEKSDLNSNKIFDNYLMRELERRLLFDASYIQNCSKTVLFLGLGRDVSWGGKPHLYYSISMDCSREEYIAQLHTGTEMKYDNDREILLVYQMDLVNADGYLRVDYYDKNSILNKHKKVKKHRVVQAECSFFDNCYHYKTATIPEPLRNWFYYKLM